MGANYSCDKGGSYGRYHPPLNKQVMKPKIIRRKMTKKSDSFRYKPHSSVPNNQLVAHLPVNSSRHEVLGIGQNERGFDFLIDNEDFYVRKITQLDNNFERSELFSEKAHNVITDKSVSEDKVYPQDNRSEVKMTTVEETKNPIDDVNLFLQIYPQDNMSEVRHTPVVETKNPGIDVSSFDKIIRRSRMSEVRKTPVVETKNPVDICPVGKVIRQGSMSEIRKTSVAETKNPVAVCSFDEIIRQSKMSELRKSPVAEKKTPVDVCSFDEVIRQGKISEVRRTPVAETKHSVDICSFEEIIRQDRMSEVRRTPAVETKNPLDICSLNKTILEDNMSEVRKSPIAEEKNPVVRSPLDKITVQDNMSEVKETSVGKTKNPVDLCPLDKIIIQENKYEVRKSPVAEAKILVDGCALDKITVQDNMSEVKETSVGKTKNPVVDICLFNDVIYRFYTEKILTDIILRTNSELFPVHKLVLCCRSVVFSDMFTKDLIAETSKVIEIAEDADTIRRLLLYIYTSEVQEMDWENAADLFKAADKYELLDLKHKCSVILKSKISWDNFCGALLFADTYHETELFDAVLDFISLVPDIFYSEGWKLFKRENPELALNTMERIINNLRISIK